MIGVNGGSNGSHGPGAAHRRVDVSPTGRRTLITGGAGFVGCNLADRLLSNGQPVAIFDNLSRPGVENNLRWLHSRHGRLISIERGDVRDAVAVRRAVSTSDIVFHLAAQVAVTTSVADPLADFEVNAVGTLNVLEAIRGCVNPPAAIMASTNKVYGALDQGPFAERGRRLVPADDVLRERGVNESRPLDFQSPYGCSKGAADQYVLDYARTYGLDTTVFRMSCIYGPRQFGTEDQGWVAHFLSRALQGQPIRLYGDGKQVRDVLFVDDLVDAFVLAMTGFESLSGQVFNVGGGPLNTISLLELIDLITELSGEHPDISFATSRPGDQRYYVSDFSRLGAAIGWAPRTTVREGVDRLYHWLAGYLGAHARPLAAVTAGFAAEGSI